MLSRYHLVWDALFLPMVEESNAHVWGHIYFSYHWLSSINLVIADFLFINPGCDMSCGLLWRIGKKKYDSKCIMHGDDSLTNEFDHSQKWCDIQFYCIKYSHYWTFSLKHCSSVNVMISSFLLQSKIVENPFH